MGLAKRLPLETLMADNDRGDSEGRVVSLRGATLKRDLGRPADGDGLKKYQQSGEPDDYRQRMITNGIALAFLIFLIGAGIWIADTMASMRKNQDCVLSGRRGCTPVEAPPSRRW
jgi:hypothetical protein